MTKQSKEKRIEMVREMARNGSTDGEIAKAIEVSRQSVFAIRKRHGIQPGRKPNVLSHGPSGYNRGCRCEECISGRRESYRKRRKKIEKMKSDGLLGEANFKHGASAYTNWGCRCTICTKEHSQKIRPKVREWQKNNPEAYKEIRKRSSRSYETKRQTETREKAGRHGYQWTGPELELASRTDLTARQVALMIGRTYASVASMRRALKKDPKVINVAGIPQKQADELNSGDA